MDEIYEGAAEKLTEVSDAQLENEGALKVLQDMQTENVAFLQRVAQQKHLHRGDTSALRCQFITHNGWQCDQPYEYDVREYLNACQDSLRQLNDSHAYIFVLRLLNQVVDNSLVPTVANKLGVLFSGGSRETCCRVCSKHLSALKLRTIEFGSVKLFEKIWESMFFQPNGFTAEDVKQMETAFV